MPSSDSYKEYATDCLRLADNEASADAKDVMLSMALAWVRLAKLKDELMSGAALKAGADGEQTAADEAPAKARTH